MYQKLKSNFDFSYSKLVSVLLLFFIINIVNHGNVSARKHHLLLKNDFRRYFSISTFGYFSDGSLKVNVNQLKIHPNNLNETSTSYQFGFTLVQTQSNNISPYIERRYNQQLCLLNEDVDYFSNNIGLVSFKMDFVHNRVMLHCNSQLSKLSIFSNDQSLLRIKRQGSDDKTHLNNTSDTKDETKKEDNVINNNKDNKPLLNTIDQNENSEKNKIDSNGSVEENPNKSKENEAISQNKNAKLTETADKEDNYDFDQKKSSCYINSFKMTQSKDPLDDQNQYSFQFQIFIAEPVYEGLYSLYFHNCLNYPAKFQELHQYTTVDLEMFIEEKNLDNYLSAGEIPLPQLYFALSLIFFIMGSIWFFFLHNRTNDTFKIHYLMGILVFVKAISLLFHGINYYFIAKEGSQVETWAVLYYITHFLKGALLFITIVLIGTGWAFVKHILSDKDKKIFMIVIPLQVIANIADIITEESEEGALIHTVWREIFILVDMICCGAILFPVIWSIRHLHEASATDGKAAINLKKLQLFRYFYVMIVIYIYFTRIIVYLLKIRVPFKYEWLEAFFQHAATLVFFILTGYHFQPTTTNPYYQLLQEDIEMDEEVLFIQPSTFSEAKKRNRDLESSDMHSLIGNRGVNIHDYE